MWLGVVWVVLCRAGWMMTGHVFSTWSQHKMTQNLGTLKCQNPLSSHSLVAPIFQTHLGINMFKFVQPRGLPNYNTHIYTPSWEMLLNMITTRNLTLKPMCSSQKWRKKHLSPVPRTLASKFTTLSETTGDWGRAELQCYMMLYAHVPSMFRE